MKVICIIQARLHSTRLPNKMLLAIQGKPILQHAWEMACEVFGPDRVVIACPADDLDALHAPIPHAQMYGYTGAVNDVLGRFIACARHYGAEVIYRVTPDDWPIDATRERVTLAMLEVWDDKLRTGTRWANRDSPRVLREHIGHLFPPRVEINSRADYEGLKTRVER